MRNIKKVALPSNGLLKNVPEEITVRDMTGGEISILYSNFNDEAVEQVVKNVIVDKEIELDDLTEQDKHLILHQTRVLTFGNILTQSLKCPYCGLIHEYEINYDNFEITLLEKDYVENNEKQFGKDELEHKYTRKVPTVGDLKAIKLFKDKFNITHQDDYILGVMLFIDKIDDKKLSQLDLLNHLKDMPGNDLVQLVKWVEIKYGLDTSYTVECESCHNTFPGGLGITPNLFR